MEDRGPHAGERQQLLALMRQHAMKKYVPTRVAPKRTTLKVFGGSLTIEEFRSGVSNVQIFMPYETHKMPTIVPNRWQGQRARWKRLWASRDARRRRPSEQQKCDEEDEPPRKFYGKVHIWETKPGVYVDSTNRRRG